MGFSRSTYQMCLIILFLRFIYIVFIYLRSKATFKITVISWANLCHKIFTAWVAERMPTCREIQAVLEFLNFFFLLIFESTSLGLPEDRGVSRDQETDLLSLFIVLQWKLLKEKQRQVESEVLKEILCSLSELPNVLIISCH